MPALSAPRLSTRAPSHESPTGRRWPSFRDADAARSEREAAAPKVAVVLAAGRGSRLAAVGRSKPTVQVAGLPLLERTIMTAKQAGLDDFIVVTGARGRITQDLALRIARRRGIRLRVVHAPHWARGNGASLLAAEPLLSGQPFILLMADHVFDAAIIQQLLGRAPAAHTDVVLAADFAVSRNSRVDPADVTRVLAQGDRIVAIGKGLARYNAFDTGVFRCTPAVFAAVRRGGRSGGALTEAVRALAAAGRAEVVDASGHFWLDVDTPKDRRHAARGLLAHLGKVGDGAVSRRLNRPLSQRFFTPLLMRVFPRITPNQVSLLSFAVAAGGGAAFALGHPLAGGALAQLASVLDGCDGEIARLKHQASPFGRFFDAVLDRYADSLLLLAAGFYGYRAVHAGAWPGEGHVWVASLVTLLALSGTWGASYTSAKAAADLRYLYRQGWTASGRGRDLRLFILFLGAALATLHVGALLGALALIGVLSNAIVVRRLVISARLAAAPPWVRARAFLFDLDGTLADSMPALTTLAVRLLSEHYGLDARDARARYLATAGADFASQLEDLFPGDARNAHVCAAFERAKARGFRQYPLFPDALPVLERLTRAGVRCALVSSTAEGLVDDYVAHHGLAHWLSRWSGWEPGQPKDRQIALAARELGLSSQEIVFVGDAPRDALYAWAAGAEFVGLARGGEDPFSRLGVTTIPALDPLWEQWSEGQRLQGVVEAV